MRPIFYIAASCFGAIISSSSGIWHLIFFKTYRNKRTHVVVSMWFSKLFRFNHSTYVYNYIHIKANGDNARSTHTTNAAIRCRIKQGVKFLYKKKLWLGEQLCKAHLWKCYQLLKNAALLIGQHIYVYCDLVYCCVF